MGVPPGSSSPAEQVGQQPRSQALSPLPREAEEREPGNEVGGTAIDLDIDGCTSGKREFKGGENPLSALLNRLFCNRTPY